MGNGLGICGRSSCPGLVPKDRSPLGEGSATKHGPGPKGGAWYLRGGRGAEAWDMGDGQRHDQQDPLQLRADMEVQRVNNMDKRPMYNHNTICLRGEA